MTAKADSLERVECEEMQLIAVEALILQETPVDNARQGDCEQDQVDALAWLVDPVADSSG